MTNVLDCNRDCHKCPYCKYLIHSKQCGYCGWNSYLGGWA